MHLALNSSTPLGSDPPHTFPSANGAGATLSPFPYVAVTTGTTALDHAGSDMSVFTARANTKQKTAPSIGFWPHASILSDTPDPFDFSDCPLSEDAQAFIREQRDKEILADCFSPSFGSKLLPGMFSSPVRAVPKPHSTGLHLITDQSAEPHSLNSFISREATSVHYDNMHDFGKLLQKAHSKYGHAPAYLFKSDCFEVFRRIPMHPLWQIQQIVTVDVIWIAIYIKYIEDFLHYMDDTFGYDMDPVLEYYAPYDKHYPKKQVALLHLWDELGLPHNIKKQEFGSSLVIIGFHIDPVCISTSISH
ncbi:hypothetical protein M422DRAFT_259710 [Sphaerobolus stellatus SS14]|uniref:Uncharacterized protein n=1 Tax=Sphaerobolus stellatus (strain SS14) TaxID=990650 RepID=A0A0C9VK72_SPHS4|nr:hypothetical protein M422DRAFT_259710 [Sphaerobolus stellatus SS14]